jgi:ATP-binding cassette subfamily B protein
METMTKEKGQPSPLAWLWDVSGKNKLSMAGLTLLQMLLGACDVAVAWLLRGIIDQAVAKDSDGFWRYGAGLFCLTVLQLAMRAVVRFLLEFTRSSVENRLKSRLFSTLLTKDYAAVTAVHSGEWMNRLTSDTVVVAEGVTSIVPEVAGMLVKLVGALCLILYMLPSLAWVLVPGGLLMVLLTYGFRKVLKRLHKDIQEKDGKLRVFLSERLSSLLVVRSFAREQQTSQEADEKMEAHKAARMRRNHFSNVCNVGFGVVMRGAYVGGAVYCGYGILMGTLSYGTFTAVLQLIGQIQSPFANITGYLPKYYAMIASSERLMEAEKFDEASAEKGLETEQIQQFYQHQFQAVGLRDVSFTYQPPVRGEDGDRAAMPVVIEHLDMQIHKGEYVAFTGPSGCGKSTLLKLLMCLYPLDSGERYMTVRDGKELPLDGRFMRLFAYVPQGNHLMSGTIRQIVTFGDASQGDDKVWSALHVACADDFVRQLPEGLDTQLGERGAGLSEGQMQRLAIARAVYSDNPILMLDEATSALDEQTEKALIENLRSMTDKTVLTVTHRQAILSVCDRQVVMAESGVTEVQKPEGGGCK